MRKNQLFALSTFAGIAGTTFLSAGATSVGSTGSLSASGLRPSQPVTQSHFANTSSSAISLKTRSITGDSVWVNFGYVQVKAIVKGKKLLNVKVEKSPNQDGNSMMIARYSLPILRKEALAAQSARIKSVSGASYTSYGYKQSLQSALVKAGIS
ncbi:MAG: FMN-binding protein [Actinobacteria bacterium]|nr:FMN-binding protein [Actinomycetota bacterium]NBY15200.1 FMN-binding protein [Actinomycetota bacterium]